MDIDQDEYEVRVLNLSTTGRCHCIWAQDIHSQYKYTEIKELFLIIHIECLHIYSSLCLNRVALTGGSSAPKHDKQDHESPIFQERVSRPSSKYLTTLCSILLATSSYLRQTRFFYSVR